MQIISRQRNSYKRGRSFEYRVKRFLNEQGYFVVRAAKSAFPDLVGVRKGEVILVECKLNGGLSMEEKVRFVEIAEVTNATCLLAYNTERAIGLKVICKAGGFHLQRETGPKGD